MDIVAEGKTKIWDVAALKVIVEEAGGKMTTLDSGKINCSLASDVASTGRLHDKVLDALKWA